jgi:DNA repair exonuclease SbcCD ATPase subunit
VRALAALPVALVLLAGCASDPEARLRSDTAAVLDAANERDADRVRDRAADLEDTVAELQAEGTLTAERAAQLTALAQSIVAGADLLDEELLEQRRQEAESEAERKRLEEERKRLEEERRQLEEDRKQEEDSKKAEQERKKAEQEAKKAEEERKKAEEQDSDVEVEIGEEGGG